MTHRVAPVPLVAFGILIVLIGITGLGALVRGHYTSRSVALLNEEHRRHEQALNSILDSIYEAGLLTRDYILSPPGAPRDGYRARLASERLSIQKKLKEIRTGPHFEDRPELDRLDRQVDAYWSAVETLLKWTPEEEGDRRWRLISEELLPRREAVLSIARQIQTLAASTWGRQRNEIDRRETAMARFIAGMLTTTLIVGVLIALISIRRIRLLETRSLEETRRAETAEIELRNLSRQLLQVHEEERKAISRELHDDVGQILTALRMEISTLRVLRSASEAEFNEHADSARWLTDQSVRAVKDIAMGLRPSILDELGLASAIQWQARTFSRHTGIPVNVCLDSSAANVAERQRTCVYRLVQEALTNCARHSHAKAIDISLRNDSQRLTVVIKDDGRGFDPIIVRGAGIGLIGMEERVTELGGKLDFSSRPGAGTVIAAEIPLPRESELYASASSYCG